MRDEWYDAWVAALDDLELHVIDSEALVANDQPVRHFPRAAEWHPPPGLGPLPPELRTRADSILERQLAASTALATAVTYNRQQASVLGKVHDSQRPVHGPLYIDCAL